MFVLLFFMNKNPLGAWGWLSVWIPIVAIILGTKAHRDKDLDGYVSYSRALGTGMLVALSGGFVFEVLAFAFTTLTGDKLIIMYLEDSAEKLTMAQAFLSPEMYEKAMTALDELKNNHARALSQVLSGDFFWKVVGGFFVSLIIAAVFKKDKPTPDQTADEQL